MSYWEFRQQIEQAIPWYVPFIPLAIAAGVAFWVWLFKEK